MTAIKHKTFSFVLFLFTSGLLLAGPPRNDGNRIRLSLAPAYSFYTINKNHATSPSPRLSGSFSCKKEFRMDHEYKTYFLIGIDYFFHGLNFKSYYFKPDTIKVYDKSFGYTYSLFIHEIDVPVQFKYLFRRENNNLYSPYLAVAYHLRYLLPGNLKVKQGNQLVKDDTPDLVFKNPLFYNKLNAFVSASLGWQKNSISANAKGVFYAELNFRYGFSQYSFQTDYAANSLYINGTHVSLQLGFRF